MWHSALSKSCGIRPHGTSVDPVAWWALAAKFGIGASVLWLQMSDADKAPWHEKFKEHSATITEYRVSDTYQPSARKERKREASRDKDEASRGCRPANRRALEAMSVDAGSTAASRSEGEGGPATLPAGLPAHGRWPHLHTCGLRLYFHTCSL